MVNIAIYGRGTQVVLIQFLKHLLLMAFVSVHLLVFEWVPVIRKEKIQLGKFSIQIFRMNEKDLKLLFPLNDILNSHLWAFQLVNWLACE